MSVSVCLMQVYARYTVTRCWHSTVFHSSYLSTLQRLHPAAVRSSSRRIAVHAASSPSQDHSSSAAGASSLLFQHMNWSWCLSLHPSTALSLWLMVSRCVSARRNQLNYRLSFLQGNKRLTLITSHLVNVEVALFSVQLSAIYLRLSWTLELYFSLCRYQK